MCGTGLQLMRKFVILCVLVVSPVVAQIPPPSGGGGAGCDKVECSGADIIAEPGIGGKLIVRQPGGTPGTDELTIEHDGTDAVIQTESGDVKVIDAAGTGWRFTIIQTGTPALRSLQGNPRIGAADSGGIYLQSGSADVFRVFNSGSGGVRTFLNCTEALPCFTFGTLPETGHDADTGIFHPGENRYAISAGAARRFEVNTSGVTIDDVMLIIPRSSAPICNAGAEGSLYADSDSNELCYCDGTSFTGLKAGGVCA